MTHNINFAIVPGAVALLAALTAAADAAAPIASDGAAFPYVAYVMAPDSHVRSGPGQQHYPTRQLPSGYAVEVYRHDGDGWCAIRPPEGSYSLVASHQVRILDQRTAEVTADGVVARVGSSLAPQHNAVQVMLKRGEIVELAETGAATGPWIKITPPAGEFRWMAARRLSRMPPLETPAAPATGGGETPIEFVGGESPRPVSWPNSGPVSSPTDAFAHLHASPAAGQTTPGSAAVARSHHWQPIENVASSASGVPSAAAAPSDEQVDIIAGSPADVLLTQHEEPADGASPAPTANQPRVRFRGLSAAGPVEPRVAELQLGLSQIVVESPGDWKLAPLREETAALLASEQSPAAREQLRDLLDRVVTFESVQARHRGAPATPALAAAPLAAGQAATAAPAAAATAAGVTGASSDVLARVRRDLGIDNGADDGITPTPGVAPPVVAQATTEALYDAVGTLKPVVSRREQAPRYALVDDHGDVVTFVTATTEVNLQPYVGKRIGVRGSRGFMPEYRRAHVTASRVTPLETTVVR